MEMLIRITDTSGLVTTTILNTKVSEVENNIRNTSDLVTKTVLNTKINEAKNKIKFLIMLNILLLKNLIS